MALRDGSSKEVTRGHCDSASGGLPSGSYPMQMNLPPMSAKVLSSICASIPQAILSDFTRPQKPKPDEEIDDDDTGDDFEWDEEDKEYHTADQCAKYHA